MTTIKADFYADWTKYLGDELSAMGFTTLAGEPPDETCFRFFNLQLRNIKPVPREVILAKTFQVDPQFQAGVDLVTRKFRNGESVRPHLSKNISKHADYDDDLLNHWGIHHLHLGTTPGPDGFVERTGPVLFVYVTADFARFLSVEPHGAWSKQALIQLVHENWSDAVRRFRINGLVAQVTDQQVKVLRAAHINSVTTVSDGTVYGPFGSGTTTSGLGGRVTVTALRYARKVRKLEALVQSKKSAILDEYQRAGLSVTSELALRLEVHGDTFFAVSDNPAASFELGPIAD